jgi:hypothetical protein
MERMNMREIDGEIDKLGCCWKLTVGAKLLWWLIM